MKVRTICIVIMLVCLAIIFYSFVGTHPALGQPAPPPPTKLTFRHVSYTVRDEDDGAGGNGVDLYMGWLVVGKASSFGGTSAVADGLKDNNGDGPKKNVHVRNEEMFSIDLPTDTVIYVKFNMI